jgi:uncharacterized membrane protein
MRNFALPDRVSQRKVALPQAEKYGTNGNIKQQSKLMKKLLLPALLLAVATSADAQRNTLIPADGLHGSLEALALSPAGKYVCGTTTAAAMFLYDTAAQTVIYKDGPTDESGDAIDSELRQVNDNGLAAGYLGSTPVTMDKDGNVTELEQYTAEDGYETCAFAVSGDGKTVVGCAFLDYSYPIVWTDGKLSQLPVPTEEEAGYTVYGAVAKFVSGDGKTIVGYLEDDMAAMPLIIWKLQDDGTTWAYDIVSKDYYEPGYGDLPYYCFSPEDISDNGRYIAVYLQRNYELDDDTNSEGYGSVGVYDLQEGKLTVFAADGNNGIDTDAEISPCDIADDGTVVGYVGSLWSGDAKPFVKRASDEQPLLFTAAYEAETAFASYDWSLATNISADGKYITGYGQTSDGTYECFVLDVNAEPAGITGATADASGSAAIVARYAVDGKRISALQRGVNIVKRANGRVEKVMVK